MLFQNTIANLQHSFKLHQMGYIRDQQGIVRRYFREKQNWEEHLSYCKNFILTSSVNKKKGTCIILGSGWLLDIPLNELSEMYSEVVLIDIIHPKQIVHKTKPLPNIKYVYDDITGGLIDFFYKSLNKQKHTKALLNTVGSFKYKLPYQADFVISLNILCQLHIILIDYLKKFNVYSQNELTEIEKAIQESHLSILPKGKSCLITDIEEEILDENDKAIGVNPFIHVDLPKGNFSAQWQWKFDTKMRYRENAKTYFNTKAIDF